MIRLPLEDEDLGRGPSVTLALATELVGQEDLHSKETEESAEATAHPFGHGPAETFAHRHDREQSEDSCDSSPTTLDTWWVVCK